MQGGEHDNVLKITVNDMGKYGCFPDCSEMMSKPLFAEANIKLRRGRLMGSVVAHCKFIFFLLNPRFALQDNLSSTAPLLF